jgi:hypothetical protein
MSGTLQIRAVPPHKCKEVLCTVRLDAVIEALVTLLSASIEEMGQKKAVLERKLAVMFVLKEMGL